MSDKDKPLTATEILSRRPYRPNGGTESAMNPILDRFVDRILAILRDTGLLPPDDNR